jgi:GT2 family glycosyltransferase
LGSAKICNQGAQEARADFLIFVSHSAVLKPGWIDALVKAAKTSDDIVVVGCKHLNSRNGRIDHAGISFLNDIGNPPMTYLYRGLRPDHPVVNRLREFQAVSAVCMLARRDTFLEVGGFDETLNRMGDIDLCLKMCDQGMRVVYSPEAIVSYKGAHRGKSCLQNSSILVSKWGDKIRSDLERLFQEDGFYLSKRRKWFFRDETRISKS